jgi:uncharacterized membrane protein HdeD (DUF308 family)
LFKPPVGATLKLDESEGGMNMTTEQERMIMTQSLAKNWWALALRGLAAVIFGILAFAWPGITLQALVLMFGVYALIDGIFDLVAAFRGENRRARWALILEGLLGIAAGVVAFVWPETAAVALLFVIAAWAIITGVLEIIAAVRLRREIDNEWLLGIAGVLSILFGLALVLFPGAGLLTLVFLIGGYAIVFGVLMIALGLRLRGHGALTETGRAHPVTTAPMPVTGEERPNPPARIHPEDPLVKDGPRHDNPAA